MKIISKFHDYYDKVLSFGIDKSLLYFRDTKESDGKLYHKNFDDVEKTAPRYEQSRYIGGFDFGCKSDGFEVETWMVGFCGKLYPFLLLSINQRNCVEAHKRVYEYAYSSQDVADFIKKHDIDTAVEKFSLPKWNKQYKKSNFLSGEYIDDFFITYNGFKGYEHVFVENNTPVFAYRLGRVTKGETKMFINPKLGDYKFFRKFDAASAFQEISMFIGGVLGVSAPETISVSDKSMAVKKGFDKQSFRAVSPGKKAKRRGISDISPV